MGMHIQVELWMWLGEKLGGDFQSPSEMRSVAEIDLDEGLSIPQLFDSLAGRYPLIEEKIFSREEKKFFPNLSVIVTQAELVVSPFSIESSILRDGYKITVLPLYAGG